MLRQNKTLLTVYAYFLFFSIGLGTLLIIVGTVAGFMSSLPKTGNWSIIIKKFFGWLMIAAGEYFLITAGKLLV